MSALLSLSLTFRLHNSNRRLTRKMFSSSWLLIMSMHVRDTSSKPEQGGIMCGLGRRALSEY